MITLRRVKAGLYETRDGRFQVRQDRVPTYRPMVVDEVEVRLNRARRWWSVRDTQGPPYILMDGCFTKKEAVEDLEYFIEEYKKIEGGCR